MILKFAFILSLTLLLLNCKKPNERSCFKSSGVTQTFVLENIEASSIEINDNISLTLVNDSLNRIEMVGGENLLGFITSSLTGNKVSFINSNRCNFMRSEDAVEIIYHYTNIDSIFLNGYGNIISKDTIKNDIYVYAEESFSSIDLIIDNQKTSIIGQIGSLETVLQGKCEQLYMYSNGAGKMDAKNLKCKYAHGHSQSLGDFYLNASEYLNIELRSAGNFYIYNAENAIKNITHEGIGDIFYP